MGIRGWSPCHNRVITDSVIPVEFLCVFSLLAVTYSLVHLCFVPPWPCSVATPGSGGGALPPSCQDAVLPQTPQNVQLAPRGALASPGPSMLSWKGRVCPACCRNALGGSAGFYLSGLSCFPAPLDGQGTLLLCFVTSPGSGEEGCSSGSCFVPPSQVSWDLWPVVLEQTEGPAVCRQTDRSVLCAPGALPGEHGKQMLD